MRKTNHGRVRYPTDTHCTLGCVDVNKFSPSISLTYFSTSERNVRLKDFSHARLKSLREKKIKTVLPNFLSNVAKRYLVLVAVHRDSILINIESHGIQSWISQSCERPLNGITSFSSQFSIMNCIHLNETPWQRRHPSKRVLFQTEP